MMAGSGDSSGLAARTMISKGHHNQLRRRRKGTIAGFSHGKDGEPASSDINGEAVSSESVGMIGPGSSGGQGNQPQHTNDSSSNPLKPCHSARLAIACCQNSIRMGARTQLGLCPPGRARRGLQAALRQRSRSHAKNTGRRLLLANFDTGGYYGLDKMIGVQSLENYEELEEKYLLSTNTFDVESDEEASSGDEDELNNIDDLLSADPSTLDEEKKYVNLREPLFTPAGAEGALSNPPSMAAMGGASTNKLPFNRRKIRYFDAVTATDRSISRSYLRQEATKCKQRGAFLLKRRLRLMQREERRRRRAEKGECVDSEGSESETENAEERILLASGISQLQHPMSASLSAALILESLSLNPLESIEGMAKCYDGIVAAGVALLDAQINDPTSPTGEEEKPRPSRSEIMAALAPLLVTSLEQPSGDAILLLAKLRRMCGTYRYQRRFVQRIAPCLIRPARAAMWCPRHQNDMEPIIAAAELIFDSASEIFSKGWYDRGQLLLADSKRAETLNTAAMQLRNLSAEPSEGLSLGFPNHGHGHRRSMFIPAHSQGKDSTTSASDLAEWEVIAVDRQIRISISNIMSSDWTRIATHSREEMSRSYHGRRSIGTSSKRPSVIPQSSSGEASPRSLSSPRSPTRMIVGGKTPLSPPSHVVSSMQGSSGGSQVENFDNIFSTSLPTQPALAVNSDRPVSPDITASAPASMTLSPPLPHRIEEAESHTPPLQHSNATPPRSPRSPSTDSVDISQSSVSLTAQPVTPVSPRRKQSPSSSVYSSKDSTSDAHQLAPFTPSLTPPTSSAPLSPASVASVGTSVSASELVSYRPSSSPSVSTSASQTAHYRMLTSTASERKRTVAACRALRAQITRFEDAFFQLHGRPPKGAAERAPLATTYSQYREWKRAIRADAACRIQALFRGYLARLMLLRSKDPAVIRVVKIGAGISSFSPKYPGDQMRQVNNQENLQLPVDINENEPEQSSVMHPPGADIYLPQGGSVARVPPPQWNNLNQIHRPQHESSNHSYAPGSTGSASPPELAHLSLPDLQARKRELKQELKRYDMNFARQHGRMPVKAEKEPIRHLYENYNALKSQISMLEQDGRLGQSSLQPASSLHSRSVSPASSVSQDTVGGDSESTNISLSTRGSRRSSRTPPPMLSNSTAAPSQDLAALKAEKGQLHQMLRSYERDFFREHRRQVSSFADIRPVASQYRRYKEIKRAIAALQQGGDN